MSNHARLYPGAQRPAGGTVGAMRLGCTSIVALMIVGTVAGAVWAGRRLLQEPEISANLGTAEDGLRGQQKIFEIARAESDRPRGRTRRVVLTESELNGFISRHLAEASKIPVSIRAVRLTGDGRVELKGRLPVRQVVAAWPLVPFTELLPRRWQDRHVWLHLWARASLEVGAARGQRRYLRLDVERVAMGHQPFPRNLLSALASQETLSLLRWRLPDSVDGMTIEPGSVVIRIAS
jgi:hypothetical protein